MPVGQGNILLGYYRGFCALKEAGLITQMPRLVAVQAQACAPLVAAWERNADRVEAVEEQETIASGVRTQAPARGPELLCALRESNGFALAVDDEAIQVAQQKLVRYGFLVEATSAVPVAAIETVQKRVGKELNILIPLSGSGLKEANCNCKEQSMK
jgi:threonine synthase